MHELEDHGGHRGDHSGPLVIPVSITISILAVLVAAVTLLGHRAHTEELLLQGQAMNQWAYYQAKNGRMNQNQAIADLLSVVTTVDNEKAEAIRAKYHKGVERYAEDKDEISEKATELQKERDLYQRRADHFDAGEGVLEFALIICSLTLLTNKRFFWFSGMAIGIAGVIVALTGFLIRV
jgi:4-hydroxy-3-methylbut-2-enyl diphosphate reductase IspH